MKNTLFTKAETITVIVLSVILSVWCGFHALLFAALDDIPMLVLASIGTVIAIAAGVCMEIEFMHTNYKDED